MILCECRGGFVWGRFLCWQSMSGMLVSIIKDTFFVTGVHSIKYKWWWSWECNLCAFPIECRQSLFHQEPECIWQVQIWLLSWDLWPATQGFFTKGWMTWTSGTNACGKFFHIIIPKGLMYLVISYSCCKPTLIIKWTTFEWAASTPTRFLATTQVMTNVCSALALVNGHTPQCFPRP